MKHNTVLGCAVAMLIIFGSADVLAANRHPHFSHYLVMLGTFVGARVAAASWTAEQRDPESAVLTAAMFDTHALWILSVVSLSFGGMLAGRVSEDFSFFLHVSAISVCALLVLQTRALKRRFEQYPAHLRVAVDHLEQATDRLEVKIGGSDGR